MHGNLDRIGGSLAATDSPQSAGAVLIAAHSLFRVVYDEDHGAGTSAPKFGLLAVGSDSFLQSIGRSVESSMRDAQWEAFRPHLPRTAGEVLEALRLMRQPGVASTYGALIHELPSARIAIDLNALTWQLGHQLRLLTGLGGTLPNEVAEEFELAVQQVIDGTRFAPERHIRQLRGRHLRIDGQQITDVDAILVEGDTILLLSCKRIELRIDYDAGDYRHVRNSASAVDRAIAEWGAKIAIINTRMRGDNFDFSSFNRVVGIVVTPELVYTNNPSAFEIERLAQLRLPRLTSIDELADLLDGRVSNSTEFKAWLSRRP
jgi:hypothetical protein